MSALPVQLTRFVGRETELAEAVTLLADTRLLTLTGPGGVGKTRLALRLASAVAEDFADGVWFVDLSPLGDGEFVWGKVAQSLEVSEPGRGRALSDAIGRRLASKRAVLILDNCEQVVMSASDVAAALLGTAPELRIIATSREPLGVGGEVTWAVPPLVEADALALFVDRARQVWPQFRLRGSDSAAVRNICRRLDGLPLAIELAAARTRVLDPAQIASGLDGHFRILPDGPRTAPSRQSTLAASFDWSHELLSGPQRALLRRLSVFAGGFDLEAALAVCPDATLEVLSELTERSLIVVEARGSDAAPRYRMLETVRQFAAEHLEEADEVALLRDRHRDHYMRLAELAEPHLTSPDEDAWRARLQIDLDNLRAALAWSRDMRQAESLVRMLGALYWFWVIPGHLAEFQMWLEAAADMAGELPPAARARILNFACLIGLFTGRSLGEVPAMANEALALARTGGDKREQSLALMYLGGLAGLMGGAEAMRPYLEEGLPLARSTGNAMVSAMWLQGFITLRWFQSDPEETRRMADEAIEVGNGLDRHHRLDGFAWASMTAILQGRLADAERFLDTMVTEGRETLDLNYLYGLLLRSLMLMFRGDRDRAHADLEASRAVAKLWEADARTPIGFATVAAFVAGWSQLAAGDPGEAIDNLRELADAARSSPLPRWGALPLVLMADAHVALNALDQAGSELEEATSLARAAALPWLLGRASQVWARLSARAGDLHEAESRAHESLGLAREAGDEMGLVDALELVARLAAEHDSNKEAARLWAAADSLRARLGYARFPIHQAPYAQAVEEVKNALGADAFAVAWEEGAKLTPDESGGYAARGRGERKRPASGWASLTPSELEVARLVGEHLSNPEIAGRLFVSRATVKTHLVHIFNKLGIDSRSQLVVEAVKRQRPLA